MSSVTLRMLPPTGRLARLRRAGGDVGSLRLIERHARVYRHAWLVFASGDLRAAVLPAVRGARPGRAGRQGAGSRRAPHPVPGVRRARPARRVLDERRDVRLDVQHLLPAEVREAVRRGPGHADAPGPGGAGRDRLGAAPRHHLRRGVHAGHAGAGPRALAVGGAGRAGGGADRLRLRRPRHDRDDVHEELAGLRLRDPGQHAALPVLRDVLPARRLPAGGPGDRRVHAAVSGRRAAARPDRGGGRPRSAVAGRLPRRTRAGWPLCLRPPPRPGCCSSDPRSPSAGDDKLRRDAGTATDSVWCRTGRGSDGPRHSIRRAARGAA